MTKADIELVQIQIYFQTTKNKYVKKLNTKKNIA
jgi:hypothetical protein